MRVIVAGGTGFIGRHLVHKLLEKSHEVVVLSRSGKSVRQAFGDAVLAGKWDAVSAGEWVRFFDEGQEPVGIINLTGESIAEGRWTEDKKRRILESRVRSAEAVAEACHKADRRPQVLVQGSAVGWYGPRGDEELDEQSGPGSGFLADVCEKWEAASKPAEEAGVRRVLARTGIVLGKKGILEKFLKSFKLYLGGPLGEGGQWLSWIHVEDEVRALIHLLEAEKAQGPYNLSAPNPVTMGTFTEVLGRVLNKPAKFRVPSALLRLGLGEMAEEMILNGQKVFPARILEMGFEFQYNDIEEAFKDLTAG